MKQTLFVLLALVFSSTGFAKQIDCKARINAVRADLHALGELMDSSPDYTKTKSNKPLEMVKEYIEKKYPGEEYTFEENAKDVDDSAVAGTCSASVGISLIQGTADTWYNEDGEGKDKSKVIEKAAERLRRHKLPFGFEGGAQGWGGSPASYVLLLDTECKAVHSFFLGISHD